MATAHNPARPLAPHLQVWRWGPHMLVSILHRATGTAMATVGTAVLVWWLAAAASGKQAYATFVAAMGWHYLGTLLGIGLTLTLFQHLANGVRHLFMDAGANFELKANKTSAIATMVFAVIATAALWAYLLGGK